MLANVVSYIGHLNLCLLGQPANSLKLILKDNYFTDHLPILF